MDYAEKLNSIARKSLYKKYGDKIDIAYNKILDICCAFAKDCKFHARITYDMVNELENEVIVEEVAKLLSSVRLDVKIYHLDQSIHDGYLGYMEINW